MKTTLKHITSTIYILTATLLLLFAIIIILFSLYNLLVNTLLTPTIKDDFIFSILESAGAMIISIAIIDVSKYMIEEEVLRDKELKKPREARQTLTKIIVIISIAVAMEGLIFIFKAGRQDITLLIYPAVLILSATFMIVGLGLYQKLSISIEKKEDVLLDPQKKKK